MPRTNLLVVLGLVASIAYLAISMRSGFIAHDEGLLAQSAERVLAGEMPHVDFNEPYTGGLSYLHAVAFRAFGPRSSSLRVMLLLFSIAFVVAYYCAASRIVAPLAAVGVVFAAVAWGVKNYFAGMPSWYNLFFATFGTLALMIDAGRREPPRNSSLPLFVAGLMGGASILIKISGVYFVLAGLLYLLYDAQVPRQREESGSRARLVDVCAWLAPPVTVAVLLVLMRHRLEAMDVLHFLLPGTLVAITPWVMMRRRPATSAPLADGDLLRRSAVFFAGVGLPLVALLALYALQHGVAGLTSLYRGLLVLPQLRFGYADTPLPPLASLLVAIPALLLLLPPVQARLRGRAAMAILAACLAAILVLSATRPTIYQGVWSVLRPLAPCFVILALVSLVWNPSVERDRRLFLLAAVVAFTSLIQYPYAFGTYFFYAAPLILLLAVDVSSLHPGPVPMVLFGFFVLFAVILLNGAEVRRFGVAYQTRDAQALLAPERINLLAPEIQARGYSAISEVVRRWTSGPEDIWAGPDTPEIYFLTGKRNPTRNFYEFFDPDPEASLLELTDGPAIRLVVINRRPEFSRPISQASRAVLAQRFPNVLDIGPMQVRWRTVDPSMEP